MTVRTYGFPFSVSKYEPNKSILTNDIGTVVL